MPITISKNKLLLVEGRNDKLFLESLIRHININDIQIVSYEGKDNLKNTLKTLKTDANFRKVSTIGIIRDADNDFNSAFDSVKTALSNSNLTIPQTPLYKTGSNPSISIYIMPNNQDAGDLEKLIIDTLQQDPILLCVSNYFDCVSKITGTTHPKLHKASIQVYLAKEDEGYVSMDTACQKGVWHLESPALDSIKTYLSVL